MGRTVGLTLIVVGLVLVLLGALAWWGGLTWFGRLPGDIRIERPGLRFYAPLVSMLIVSLVITVLAGILRKLWP